MTHAATFEKLQNVRFEINKFIYGQEDVVLHALCAILSGGHMLLLGVPGLAKSRLVSTISKTIGLESKRIQCTPDLMPSDLIGMEILEEVDYGRRNFRFVHGPIFCQFLMVDEINRASPRTQSALLQAMQEGNITMTGKEYTLPRPFHVMATQNPIEQEGTYPLPEAQLDRFLIQIHVDYPSQEAERKIIEATSKPIDAVPHAYMFDEDLRAIQQEVREMTLPDSILSAILTISKQGRPQTSSIELIRKYVKWGPSPRASQALALCSRACALLHGRNEPETSDLAAMIKPVLAHRITLNYEAHVDGVTMDDVLQALLHALR